jgi:hypothetical protein
VSSITCFHLVHILRKQNFLKILLLRNKSMYVVIIHVLRKIAFSIVFSSMYEYIFSLLKWGNDVFTAVLFLFVHYVRVIITHKNYRRFLGSPALRHTHICGVMNSKSLFCTLRIDQWTPTTNQIRLFYDMSMWTQLYRTEWAIKSWHATEDTKSLSLDDPWWSIGQIKPE